MSHMSHDLPKKNSDWILFFLKNIVIFLNNLSGSSILIIIELLFEVLILLIRKLIKEFFRIICLIFMSCFIIAILALLWLVGGFLNYMSSNLTKKFDQIAVFFFYCYFKLLFFIYLIVQKVIVFYIIYYTTILKKI